MKSSLFPTLFFVTLRNAAGHGKGGYRNLTTTLLYCFSTPPSFGHLPYISLRKTQGRRIEKLPFSHAVFCDTPQCCGTRQGERLNAKYFIFSNPSVSLCHLLFIALQLPVMLRDRAGAKVVGFLFAKRNFIALSAKIIRNFLSASV